MKFHITLIPVLGFCFQLTLLRNKPFDPRESIYQNTTCAGSQLPTFSPSS